MNYSTSINKTTKRQIVKQPQQDVSDLEFFFIIIILILVLVGFPSVGYYVGYSQAEYHGKREMIAFRNQHEIITQRRINDHLEAYKKRLENNCGKFIVETENQPRRTM